MVIFQLSGFYCRDSADLADTPSFEARAPDLGTLFLHPLRGTFRGTQKKGLKLRLSVGFPNFSFGILQGRSPWNRRTYAFLRPTLHICHAKEAILGP